MGNKKSFYESKKKQWYLTSKEFLAVLQKLAKSSNQRLKDRIRDEEIHKEEILNSVY
jgi:hypothetical protein